MIIGGDNKSNIKCIEADRCKLHLTLASLFAHGAIGPRT